MGQDRTQTRPSFDEGRRRPALRGGEEGLSPPRRRFYRQVNWAVLVVTLAIYYLLPFVRWDRGPNEPSQAVLVDLAHRRFYFFWIEMWPQEVYYFTGLLIIAGAEAVPDERARRPRLVRLSVSADRLDRPFFAVERWVEGDRRERMMLDAGPHGSTRRGEGRQACDLVDHRLVDRRRLGALFRRRAAPGLEPVDVSGALHRLRLDRRAHLHDLFLRRLHARAGVPLHVPVAAHPGGADRRARAQRRLSLRPRRAAHVAEESQGRAGAGREGRAIASTAPIASRSARPASTSATARASAASSAACASTPATR